MADKNVCPTKLMLKQEFVRIQNGPGDIFQRHHVVIAIIAIVVAVALVLNYYLW